MGIEAVAEAEDERSRLLDSVVGGASSSSSSPSSLKNGRGRYMNRVNLLADRGSWAERGVTYPRGGKGAFIIAKRRARVNETKRIYQTTYESSESNCGLILPASGLVS